MSRVISIRLPDKIADQIEASGIDKAAVLDPKPQTQQQQIDRITIRIDMR
nr:unnamed protein product [uncultured bacterium]